MMVHIQILTSRWEPTQQQIVEDVRAELWVDGDRVEIRGEIPYIPFDVPVINPENRQQLRLNGPDPEAWARCLPDAFRTGDIVARVAGANIPAPEPALAHD